MVPQAGETIRLGASLIDYDPTSSDDQLGNEIVVAPFETGWRKEVQILLTGDEARVVVTLGLQPI